MKKRNRSLFIILALIIVGCSSSKESKSSNHKGYTPVSQELYEEIAHMDSVMFNAFNAHDVEKLKTTFSEALEKQLLREGEGHDARNHDDDIDCGEVWP